MQKPKTLSMSKGRNPHLSRDGIRPLRLTDALEPPRRQILDAEWKPAPSKESEAKAELFYWFVIIACVAWIILAGYAAVLTRIQLYGSVW